MGKKIKVWLFSMFFLLLINVFGSTPVMAADEYTGKPDGAGRTWTYQHDGNDEDRYLPSGSQYDYYIPSYVSPDTGGKYDINYYQLEYDLLGKSYLDTCLIVTYYFVSENADGSQHKETYCYAPTGKNHTSDAGKKMFEYNYQFDWKIRVERVEVSFPATYNTASPLTATEGTYFDEAVNRWKYANGAIDYSTSDKGNTSYGGGNYSMAWYGTFINDVPTTNQTFEGGFHTLATAGFPDNPDITYKPNITEDEKDQMWIHYSPHKRYSKEFTCDTKSPRLYVYGTNGSWATSINGQKSNAIDGHLVFVIGMRFENSPPEIRVLNENKEFCPTYTADIDTDLVYFEERLFYIRATDLETGLNSENTYEFYVSKSPTILTGGTWKPFNNPESKYMKGGETESVTGDLVLSGKNNYIFVKTVYDDSNGGVGVIPGMASTDITIDTNKNLSVENNNIVKIGDEYYHRFGPYNFYESYTVKYNNGNTSSIVEPPADQKFIITVPDTLAVSIYLGGQKYSVMYNTNKGTGSSVPTPCENITGRMPFIGWEILTHLYAPGEEVVDLTHIPKKVLDATAMYQDVDIILPTTSRDGYTFVGWYEGDVKIGDAGDTYIFDANVIQDSNKTFTAHWVPDAYTITFNYNGGTNPGEDTRIVHYDEPVGDLPETKKTGYTLVGWYTTNDDTGTKIGGGPMKIDSDITLNAIWRANTYFIAYELNGGEYGTNHPLSATYDEFFSVDAPTRSGWVFAGWDIYDMDTNLHYVGDMTSTLPTLRWVNATSFKNLTATDQATIRFVANWAGTSYGISYDLQGGEFGEHHPTDAEFGTSFTVSNPTYAGHTFRGWTISGMDNCLHYIGSETNTGSDIAGVKATVFSNLRASAGDVKFTAIWDGAEREVVFFTDGGVMTGSNIQDDAWTVRFINMGDTDFHANTKYGILWNTGLPQVTKAGYQFTGYKGASGELAYNEGYNKVTGHYWDAEGKWIGPSLILQAQYTPREYTITFLVNTGFWNGGTDELRTKNVIYDSPQNSLVYNKNDLYKIGYTFMGWYDTLAEPNLVFDTDGKAKANGGYWSMDYVD